MRIGKHLAELEKMFYGSSMAYDKVRRSPWLPSLACCHFMLVVILSRCDIRSTCRLSKGRISSLQQC